MNYPYNTWKMAEVVRFYRGDEPLMIAYAVCGTRGRNRGHTSFSHGRGCAINLVLHGIGTHISVDLGATKVFRHA
jgi:hypothetical protein